MEKINLERDTGHTEVESTYSIINSPDGTFLQIDTYGSKNRQEQGKKSQSIRFSPESLKQLKLILNSEF